MSLEEIKREINRLAPSEKLGIVEDIWNQIAKDNDSIPIYDWQKRELDIRYNELQKGKLERHDWKIVHNNIREQYK